MKHHLVIANTNTHPEFLGPLRARLELEWGTIDPFEGTDADITVPSPLVLLEGGTNLAGGLAFSSYRHPDKQKNSVWINALLVEPEYRGRGFASKLVLSAEAEAANIKLKELFVLTEFPKLYRKLGWNLIETVGSDSVLAKSVGS